MLNPTEAGMATEIPNAVAINASEIAGFSTPAEIRLESKIKMNWLLVWRDELLAESDETKDEEDVALLEEEEEEAAVENDDDSTWSCNKCWSKSNCSRVKTK